MKLSNGKMAALIIAAIVLIDQAIKVWVKTHMFYDQEIVIFDWMRIHFIENNGMAFGMELGSKLFLTSFRMIAVGVGIYFLSKIASRSDIAQGFKICIAMIIAGALGNLIDCLFYGLIFDNPPYPFVATLFPEGGGYGSLFYGRVVDMFYFPLVEWNWPDWMPWCGGRHFLFFQPIFNFADASLSVSVIVLILFYSKYFSVIEGSDKDTADTPTDNE